MSKTEHKKAKLKPMFVRLPPELHKKIKQDAESNHRTLVGQVLFLIEKGMQDAA